MLLFGHGIKNGHDPLVKLAIDIIRGKHIANSIQSLGSQLCSFQIELSRICWSKTLQTLMPWKTGRASKYRCCFLLAYLAKPSCVFCGARYSAYLWNIHARCQGFVCATTGHSKKGQLLKTQQAGAVTVAVLQFNLIHCIVTWVS